MYHSIATTAAPRFARFVTRPADFAAQMAHLAAEGYQPITALDLARKRAIGDSPARPVVLTFDDAFTDFETAVMPILQKHGFPATLYVPTAYAGRTASWLRDCNEDRRPVLSWRALSDVVSVGIEVASHSHTHPQLDRLAMPLVRDEVRRSRLILEDNLGVPIEGFAYPFGYWNGNVRSSVSAAGYSYACAVGELPVPATADPLTLPRVTVAGGVDVDGFARLLAGSSTPVARLSSELKRQAWRTVRRHIRSVGGDPQPVQDHGGAAGVAESAEQVPLPAPEQSWAHVVAQGDDNLREEGRTSRHASDRL
jgi:peptidoglycan/xylan/chitin deacetylase (PgdA/CDA1 family)